MAEREAGLINMMLPLLSRSTGRLARHPVHLLSRACTRTTRNFTTQPGIPVGASPQLLLSAVASHRSGASMDLARVIFEHGGSIAGTKKVMLENHFAMLIAVYTPPTSFYSMADWYGPWGTRGTRRQRPARSGLPVVRYQHDCFYATEREFYYDLKL